MNFMVWKLLRNNIEQVLDSSSPFLCLHIDEQSGCWIKVKMLNSDMETGLTEDCEFNSLFLEEVERPFSIAESFDSSLFLDCFPDFWIWDFFSVIDVVIRPCSVWIASSSDEVFCCFSHRWKNLWNMINFKWFHEWCWLWIENTKHWSALSCFISDIFSMRIESSEFHSSFYEIYSCIWNKIFMKPLHFCCCWNEKNTHISFFVFLKCLFHKLWFVSDVVWWIDKVFLLPVNW